MLQSCHAAFFLSALPSWFAWDPCLPYALALIYLAIGLVVAFRTDMRNARGFDGMILLAPVFIAVPMAVFGGDHMLAGREIASAIPSWIPWKIFWAYFVGTCLLAGALSLVTRKYAGLAAALFGIMMLMFEALLHIPRVVSLPGDRFAWAVMFREFAFSGGVLAFAATQTKEWKASGSHWVLPLTRFFIGIPLVFFAVEQLMHPEFVPAIPLKKLTPGIVPFHLLWGYPTGAVFLICAFGLLTNRRPRMAAKYVGLMTMVVIAVVYTPMMIQNAADISSSLNFFADTLLLAGCVFGFAGSQPVTVASTERTASHVSELPAHETP